LKLYPKDPELLFRNGILLHEDGRLRAAELSHLAALANNDALHFSSIDRGIVGFKARHNLAAVYADIGALHKAEAEWRRIVEEVPTYRDGWRGLVDNLFQQGRLRDAAEVGDRMLRGDVRLHGLGMALVARVWLLKRRANSMLPWRRSGMRDARARTMWRRSRSYAGTCSIAAIYESWKRR
jgi:tetratricopeptide (TPR) repeat protein